jgi:hypothetical protein
MSAEPTFQPWIGEKYEDGLDGGVQLLVLGESHYGQSGTEEAGFTQTTVVKLGQNKRNPFFTIPAKLVLGMDTSDGISDRERSEFWDRVAFYNYVQEFIDEGARGDRPTTQMWQEAEEPFLNVLQDLNPDALLVLGKGLGNNLPDLDDFDGEVCVVTHPTSGKFSYDDWQPAVQKMLDRAKSKKN